MHPTRSSFINAVGAALDRHGSGSISLIRAETRTELLAVRAAGFSARDGERDFRSALGYWRNMPHHLSPPRLR